MSADIINALETCCASCGVAGVDEIKLKKARVATSFDTAASNAREITGHSTNELAGIEQLNCVMSCYSSNQRAPIVGTVRSAVSLCLLIRKNSQCMLAAAK